LGKKEKMGRVDKNTKIPCKKFLQVDISIFFFNYFAFFESKKNQILEEVYTMKGYEKSRGFTLIELAIVLVIIGLLLGAVMKGKELIQAAKVKRVMKQAHAAISAAETFYDYTGKWPGSISKHSDGTPNAGTDLCSLEVVRLYGKDDNGNDTTWCADPAQRAFEFWGAAGGQWTGYGVLDKNGNRVKRGIWLDGMGRVVQGDYLAGTEYKETGNPAANALFVTFSEQSKVIPIVCFYQDDWKAAMTTTAAQRKAMISIARMYAGDSPILNVDCINNSEYQACVGDWSEVKEGQWEAEGTFTPASSLAQKELQACVRLSVE